MIVPRALGITAVRLYQATAGRIVVGNCRFYPSCSEYAAQAMEKNGLVVGSMQAAWRILRCGPWSKGGVDRPRDRRHVHGPEALDG